MTKNVLVSISGLHSQLVDDPTDPKQTIESITPGVYYYKEGVHYIFFEEVAEGIHQVTKNRIKIINENYMQLSKTGVSNVHMLFERGKKNLTYYRTEVGSMMVGLDTFVFQLSVTEEKISVHLEYMLDINSEPLTRCHVDITVVPQNEDGYNELFHSEKALKKA